jgi:Cu+-exporting ATPase
MADDKVHIDPVCGMEVNENNAAGKTDNSGQTYYFCSAECKNRFDINPAEYALSIIPKKG